MNNSNTSKIEITTERLKDMQNQMNMKKNEIREKIIKMSIELDETKRIYDSKAAKHFREGTSKFTNELVHFLDNELTEQINKITTISKNYEILNQNDADSIGGIQ